MTAIEGLLAGFLLGTVVGLVAARLIVQLACYFGIIKITKPTENTPQ